MSFRVCIDALTGFQPVFHRMLLTETGASGAPEQIVEVIKGSPGADCRSPMPQIQEQIVQVIDGF